MRRRFIFVVFAFGLALVTAGAVLAPRLGKWYVRAQDKPGQLWTSTGHGADYAGPVIEVLPSIEISAPRTIRLTKSGNVSVSIWGTPIGHSSDLIPGSEGIASDQPPKIDNRLADSYTVDVKANDDVGLVCVEPKTKKMPAYPASIDPQVWDCTIHPKQAGDYEILVSGLPPAKEAGNRFLVSDVPEGGISPTTLLGAGGHANGHAYDRLPGGDVSLHLQVLTSQGFTAIQFVWLQTVGALIGTLGTVLAYPFLKSKFGDKPAQPPPAKLSLEDMTIDELPAEMISRAGNVVFRYELPVLQLFVRNAGGEVAVVSRAKLSVKQIWHLHLQHPLAQLLEPSASYNIDIDPSRKAPYEVEIPVSHSIAPNESDRFDITLGLNPLEAFESLYHIEISLFFNKQWTWSNTIDGIVVLPARKEPEPQYFISAFHQHHAELEEQYNQMPTDVRELPPYKQVHWERRRKELEEDLSPQGVEQALRAAAEIAEYNRGLLSDAARSSVRRSPRATELISRLTANTQERPG